MLWPVSCNIFFIVVIFVASFFLGVEVPGLGLPILSVSVFPACFIFYVYLRWWNEEYLVTNRRVIQAEGIINKRVIDSSLEKVNDVVLSQSWVGRFMDFGDVDIMTASEMGVNNLSTIRHPLIFKTEMMAQKEALGLDEYRGARQEAKGQIPDLISSLERLWREGVLTDEEFKQKKAQLLERV